MNSVERHGMKRRELLYSWQPEILSFPKTGACISDRYSIQGTGFQRMNEKRLENPAG